MGNWRDSAATENIILDICSSSTNLWSEAVALCIQYCILHL